MDNPSYTIPDDRAHMWITGYFPNGFKASFTLSVSLASAFDEGMAFTQRLAAQGFTINPPGLESGEERFLAARVVRREKYDERRQRNVQMLDLYTDHGKFRELLVYLNEPEDEKAFEQAAGVTLASLPLCENDAPFKLDGDLTKANKYLRTLPKPLGVVRKHNPAYDPQSDNKKAKWLFVRWDVAAQQPSTVDTSTGEIVDEKPATPKGKPVQVPKHIRSWTDFWTEWKKAGFAPGDTKALYLVYGVDQLGESHTAQSAYDQLVQWKAQGNTVTKSKDVGMVIDSEADPGSYEDVPF